jgi:hypothetical protein
MAHAEQGSRGERVTAAGEIRPLCSCGECRQGPDAPNLSGLCECGCGARTAIVERTDRTQGRVRGEHVRFVRGHSGWTLDARRGRHRFAGRRHTAEARAKMRAARARQTAERQAEAERGREGPPASGILEAPAGAHPCPPNRHDGGIGHEGAPAKACSRCGRELPLEEFWRDRRALDGRYSACGWCSRELRRERYGRDRELELERERARRRRRVADPAVVEAAAARRRAWKRANRERVNEGKRRALARARLEARGEELPPELERRPPGPARR